MLSLDIEDHQLSMHVSSGTVLLHQRRQESRALGAQNDRQFDQSSSLLRQ